MSSYIRFIWKPIRWIIKDKKGIQQIKGKAPFMTLLFGENVCSACFKEMDIGERGYLDNQELLQIKQQAQAVKSEIKFGIAPKLYCELCFQAHAKKEWIQEALRLKKSGKPKETLVQVKVVMHRCLIADESFLAEVSK